MLCSVRVLFLRCAGWWCCVALCCVMLRCVVYCVVLWCVVECSSAHLLSRVTSYRKLPLLSCSCEDTQQKRCHEQGPQRFKLCNRHTRATAPQPTGKREGDNVEQQPTPSALHAVRAPPSPVTNCVTKHAHPATLT